MKIAAVALMQNDTGRPDLMMMMMYLCWPGLRK